MSETFFAMTASSWGVLMALSPVLQIARMRRRRSSADFSLGYFTVLMVGFVLWIAYGVVIRNAALIVPNAVALIVGAATVIIAIRYRGSCPTSSA